MTDTGDPIGNRANSPALRVRVSLRLGAQLANSAAVIEVPGRTLLTEVAAAAPPHQRVWREGLAELRALLADEFGDPPARTHPRRHIATLRREVELLRERLAEKDDVIADLRQRLDREGNERRSLAALLIGERPPLELRRGAVKDARA